MKITGRRQVAIHIVALILEITIQCKLQEQAVKLHHTLPPKHTLLSNVLLQFCQTCDCYSPCQLDSPCRTHTIDHRVASLGCWAAITPEACHLSNSLCHQIVIPASAFALKFHHGYCKMCVSFIFCFSNANCIKEQLMVQCSLQGPI